jgi:hypothetical protein
MIATRLGTLRASVTSFLPKYCWILGLLFLSTAALGQHGFNTVIPDQPVDFGQVNDSNAWVRGHWIAADPASKKDELAGPSTSEISCNHSSKTCIDTNANIVVIGSTFELSGGHDEYAVERWDSREIVASNVGGICRVRNVLKFDRVQKRVYWMQVLSEPIDDLPKGIKECKLVGMNLELKNSTLWVK